MSPSFFLHGFVSEFIVQNSNVCFSDVGGCSECLREVNKLLLHMKQPELFARLGVRPPQGFLLHGPPGCGKTLIANAIAGVSVKFFKILLFSWITVPHRHGGIFIIITYCIVGNFGEVFNSANW